MVLDWGGSVKELYECRSGRYRWIESDKARRFIEAHRGDMRFATRMYALSNCEFEDCLKRTTEYDSVTFQASSRNATHIQFLEYFANEYREWLQSQAGNSAPSTSSLSLSQISDIAKTNRSIIEQLQSGVHCNRVHGELKRVRVLFSDGESQEILPTNGFFYNDKYLQSDYQLSFVSSCIGVPPPMFHDRCLQNNSRDISSRGQRLTWISPNQRTYPIQSMTQRGNSEKCNVQRNMGGTNILSNERDLRRGGDTTRRGTQ